jgi:hypothetical protein
MIRNRNLNNSLDRAPYESRTALETLVARAMLVKTPGGLIRGVRKRSKRCWLSRRVRRLWWVLQMRVNKGVCSIEIANTTYGFFAQMNCCLWIFEYCEHRGLVPYIRLANDTYRDTNRGPNWLDHYFDAIHAISSDELLKRARHTKKVFELEDIEQFVTDSMTIDGGARTFNKYLRLKPHIVRMVEDFWNKLGVSGPVLGIHFRGTDHSRESPRVSYQHCLSAVRKYLREHDGIEALFVASDEHEFIRFIKRSIKDVPVYWHDDHHRSLGNDPMPVFLGSGGGYEKGEDALVNALLLAKCPTLIRTTSTLSAWASIFNPELKVILLNKPYRNNLWYPESQIIGRPDTEYWPEDACIV